jgi:hypothetical protein
MSVKSDISDALFQGIKKEYVATYSNDSGLYPYCTGRMSSMLGSLLTGDAREKQFIRDQLNELIQKGTEA